MAQVISVLGGQGRMAAPDLVERVDLVMGEVTSIVGPTGSGKTTLINDIELFADRDTPSGRRVLFDEEPAPLAVVESIVGHSSPAMTRFYTHVGEIAAANAVASLPAIMGDAKPEAPKPDAGAVLARR